MVKTSKDGPRRQIVVPCGSGEHKVRLAGGLRFWRGARCPVCGSPVDATRLRRAGRFWANLVRPADPALAPTLLWWLTASFVVAAAVTAVLLWAAADRWWPATVLLFGPRWLLLLPLGLLVPAALVWDRPLLLPLVLSGLVVVGPVMGFRTGWRGLLPGDESGIRIRVATFNARGGETLLASPSSLLIEWEADVAAFQECGPALATALRELPDWHVDTRGSQCFASRFPHTSVDVMDREAIAFAGGSGLVVTWSMEVDGLPIHLTSVHLETPRAGFERIRAGRLSEGIPMVQSRSLLRDVELRRARSWVDGFQGPHVVVGDFNTPPESRSYRESWGDWQNAFSLKGRGLGGTRLNGWIRARIDHVVVDRGWKVVSASVGKDAGSDHLPVIADIVARGR